jgi:hypothetical protein
MRKYSSTRGLIGFSIGLSLSVVLFNFLLGLPTVSAQSLSAPEGWLSAGEPTIAAKSYTVPYAPDRSGCTPTKVKL